MDPDEALARLAAEQHAVFTHAQARRAGLSEGQIRRRRESGRWFVPYEGVYVVSGAPNTRDQQVLAAVFAYGRFASASHRDAASLLRLIPTPSGIVDVMLADGHHREPRPGVRTHQAALTLSDIRTVRGIRATTANRTFVDLASIAERSELEAALDAAILGRLTTALRIHRYVRDRNLKCRRGMGVLRELLADRFDGALQLALERMFARKIAQTDLPRPARQFPFNERRIDFAYPDLKIAIELDGLYHATGPVFRSDRRRETMLNLAGWMMLHFTYDDVDTDWPYVESRIREALALRVAVLHGR